LIDLTVILNLLIDLIVVLWLMTWIQSFIDWFDSDIQSKLIRTVPIQHKKLICIQFAIVCIALIQKMPRTQVTMQEYAFNFWTTIIAIAKEATLKEEWINQEKLDNIVNHINSSENLDLKQEFDNMVDFFIEFPKKFQGKGIRNTASRRTIRKVIYIYTHTHSSNIY